MEKIKNFFKNNIIYVIVLALMIGAFCVLIPNIFIDMFKISYTNVEDEIIRIDFLSLNYAFQNLGEWFEKGNKAFNEMFIQYTFIIICLFGLIILLLITSFILNIFKEKMSTKIEFLAGALAIAAAILSFLVVFLLIIMVTSLEMKPVLFEHKSATVEMQTGYYLSFIPAVLFLLSGVLLTANSSEKNTL